LENRKYKIYNLASDFASKLKIMSVKIQNLLEQANYSKANDSSVTFAERMFSSESDAEDFFIKTKKKLADINVWNEKSTPSNYELFDENASVCESKIIIPGRFIRIGIPASGKFDWVKVFEIIDDAPNEFIIRVHPAYDPTETPIDKTVVSHFFTNEATNNFCLQKVGKDVQMYVIGLNEKANVREAGGLIEAARNAATANAGYYLGMQKTMWKEFCANFLEIKEKE
jgi:hypothetical protein